MAEDKQRTVEALADALELIDEREYPGTATFIKDLKLLAEHFADESGSIDVNELALSLVSTVGYLESRIKDLEAAMEGRRE